MTQSPYNKTRSRYSQQSQLDQSPNCPHRHTASPTPLRQIHCLAPRSRTGTGPLSSQHIPVLFVPFPSTLYSTGTHRRLQSSTCTSSFTFCSIFFLVFLPFSALLPTSIVFLCTIYSNVTRTPQIAPTLVPVIDTFSNRGQRLASSWISAASKPSRWLSVSWIAKPL